MEWWRNAACVDEDPELFFPVGVSGPAAQEQQARAREVCGRCPVREECLEYALNTGVSHGVWGGTDEEERRALRRRARRPVRRQASSGSRSDERSASHAVSKWSDQRASR